MTSVSQPQSLPLQSPASNSGAPQSVAPAPSASAASGTTSPQASAGRGFTNNNSAAARKSGSGASASTAHTRSAESVSGAIPPAVPVIGGPTIANGSNVVSAPTRPGDHSRKSSVTISASGATGTMPNGGPVAGKPASGNNIQFGSIQANASPAMSNSAPQPVSANGGAGNGSLAASTPPNPRVTSPATSPSPIPQPPASGGRPPSSITGSTNAMTFGSIGNGGIGDEASNRPYGPAGPANPQQSPMLRRETSQSSHTDMPHNGGGRGGYPQGAGRARGVGYQHVHGHQQQYGQPPPFSPAPPNFRGAPPNAPRAGQHNMGGYGPVQHGGRPMGPGAYGSPHQAARSPALAHSQPMHAPPGPMPMASPNMPPTPYGAYQHQMPPQQTPGWQGGFDPQYAYYSSQMMNPGMQMQPMQMQGYAPPRPPFNNAVTPGAQGPYMQGQYPGQPMSRTPSDVSNRPSSAIGHPQTPMTPAVGAAVASRGPTQSPAPKTTNFQLPAKRSSGIQIRDPTTGQLKTFDKTKVESPAPSAPSVSPAPVPGPEAATPPSQTPSVQHGRSESQSVKTNDEKRSDMKDAVARRLKEAEEAERKAQEQKERKEEEVAMDNREKVDAETKAKEASAAPAPTSTSVSEAPLQAPIIKTDDSSDEEAEIEPEPKAEPEVKVTEPPTQVEPSAPATDEVPDMNDEEYWKRIEAEEEEKDRERERKYQEKKAVEMEKKAKQAAEEAARLDEELKRQEREAEALEEARMKRLESGNDDEDREERQKAFASLSKDPGNAFKATQSSSVNETPAESGAATPASDGSMGPPPRNAAASKQKAAKLEPLKLETSKQVEAPQPSAALQSLRSARFLSAINEKTYPPAIASPNPALNSAAPMGKFRYDKNFLMQFQNVFVEKPSETWNEKVKETVGDTSETPSSARPGRGGPTSSMPPRSGSQRSSVMNQANVFGKFGTFNTHTLPPNSTSQSRFEAANRQQQQPPGGPMRYQPGAPGAFPMPFGPPGMARTASSTSMGYPQSPRNNPSHRGSGRGSKAGNKRDTEKEAKTMPLTAGQDLKPIVKTEQGWKPRSVGANAMNAGPPPGGDGHLAPDVVQRKVKSYLNKMTPTTFDKITDQILSIVMQSKEETDGRTLRQVIQETFNKATDESHWAQMYAQLCARMLGAMSPAIRDETMLDKDGNVNSGGTLFRKYLLNRCQQDFEAGWKSKLPDKPEGEEGSHQGEAAMMSEEYYRQAALKRRGLGLVKFIGELFKLGMLTSRIMHLCMVRLLDYEGVPDENEMESLVSLLRTIGQSLDAEEKGRPHMDAYFDRINKAIKVEGLPSRVKFMLMDLVDLRKKGWQGKEATKGPATIEEVRAQAAQQEREKEAQRAADNANRRAGGGGGRPGQGRGDARQFSGGPMMPPPQQNTVAMDDIRRLGRGGSRPSAHAGGGPPSFGPTSMFASRGSNTSRRSLAPGGGLLGRGEDSSASSRTGTPPIAARNAGKEKDEKEAAKNINTYSALAALDSGETNDTPGSPPTTAASPPAAKAPASGAIPAPPTAARSKSPAAAESSGGA